MAAKIFLKRACKIFGRARATLGRVLGRFKIVGTRALFDFFDEKIFPKFWVWSCPTPKNFFRKKIFSSRQNFGLGVFDRETEFPTKKKQEI